MTKVQSFTAAAKALSVVAAIVLFAPVAFATLMQAAQIVG